MDRKMAGQVDELQIRRVGARHCVVTPPRRTELVDIYQWQQQLEAVERRLKHARNAKAQAEALESQLITQREQLRAQLQLVASLPIDRCDGDPDVPALPVDAEAATEESAPEPEPPLEPEPPAPRTRPSGKRR